MAYRKNGHDNEFQRIRTGLIVLLVGVVVLLAALGIAIVRSIGPSVDSGVQDATAPGGGSGELSTRVGAAAIVLGIVLVVTLLITSYALFRITRRFATAELSRKPQPTPDDDVWQMHRLPEAAAPEDQGGEEPPPGARG